MVYHHTLPQSNYIKIFGDQVWLSWFLQTLDVSSVLSGLCTIDLRVGGNALIKMGAFKEWVERGEKEMRKALGVAEM